MLSYDSSEMNERDSKLEPWLSDAEHATSRKHKFPTIFNLYE